MAQPNDDTPLGECCICEGTPVVRTIIMLTKKSPIPGRGWGCVVCDLDANGAIAVVCLKCEKKHGKATPKHLRYACRGYPATDGRVPIAELQGEHRHDLKKHRLFP